MMDAVVEYRNDQPDEQRTIGSTTYSASCADCAKTCVSCACSR